MTNQCGNPKDTGQQLMAANIGYDQSVTGLAAAHVQAAIDLLYDSTGLGYHPNFTGREAADSHPAEAITGLIDALAGKAGTNHTQPATTVSYDNTIANVLIAVEVQAALDELATTQQAGVSEWSAVAVEVVPAEGIAASVNQMDWTGHAHADTGVPTALSITSQDIITFSNGTGQLYRWIGVKGVLVGLGGNYATVTGDYEATGSDDHAALSNRDAVDSHPQASITDLVADQGVQDTNIGTNTTDIGTNATNHTNHLADVANPHGVTAAQVGAEPANVNIQAHIGATNNPHNVTAEQLGITGGGGRLIDYASSTGENVLSENAWAKSLIETIDSATASDYGAFDLANNRWTATAACRVVTAWIGRDSATGNRFDNLGIFKNGLYVHHWRDPFAAHQVGVDSGSLASTGSNGANMMVPVDLGIGDYVEVWIYSPDPVAQTQPTMMHSVEVVG